MPDRVREHDVVLRGERVVLRPLTEDDWPTLLRWDTDPDVLYFSEGDDVTAYSLEDVHYIYRSVSQTAYCFMIELDGRPIGECWLQRMNLPRILEPYPDQDCRRIDLLIGERALWGQGLGTEAIRLLCRFGFESDRADALFGCGVADYNPRSRRAFERVGFLVCAMVEEPPGAKARRSCDLVLTRERWCELTR